MEIVKKFGRDYFYGLDLFKPLPEELTKKREALGIDENDLLVHRPSEKGGVNIEIVKNGKSLKKVKGGLENYFKAKKEMYFNVSLLISTFYVKSHLEKTGREQRCVP